MIRTIIDLIGFFNSLSGFLVAVFFWSILTITFAKSIKKHARFLYSVLWEVCRFYLFLTYSG